MHLIKPIVTGDIDLKVFSDASKLGWGASHTDKRTGGLWAASEIQTRGGNIDIFCLTLWGVKMCDKMAISAYILKIVKKDPFLRLQMRAKEMSNRHQFFPQISKT